MSDKPPKTTDDSSSSEAAERIKYWDKVYGTLDPPKSANVGLFLAATLPYFLYNHILPNIDDHSVFTVKEEGGTAAFEHRIKLLFSLQILPAVVSFVYIWVTGSVRIPYSPAAAHDPAAMYAANLMPVQVHAANRAFANTLEQYLFLWTTSCALAVQLPSEQLMILPTLYITWSICRILYVIGYVYGGGSGRMLGFPGTVMPTTAGLFYAIYLLLIRS
mmetsp:Transcript_54150/g.131398  ORF Transcript_54150/g.131398 Transcript_54150/m.131398 type:complete len:218 (+) Transcript_54150:444-1097(+)|eukprot:CAMPEP_0113468288 /NCGR_PEP_ID=MMETSP0014_2-20120614/15273_1 /TAXON_ID=2857 /ORGANISM="Nitzschia sp." /LENGTH=217 /DNA_ID=CAMNT_0000360663 /DNA_START=420 /DNA_END=1073 /DNA_ORIENTATION=+ /assembly_acc=CAM_ASM_000159